jgi:hypothetical protein
MPACQGGNDRWGGIQMSRQEKLAALIAAERQANKKGK